jgi:hypothetical protein
LPTILALVVLLLLAVADSPLLLLVFLLAAIGLLPALMLPVTPLATIRFMAALLPAAFLI